MIKYLELKLVTAQHGSEISEAVQRVVDSGWYLQGAENKAFCEEFASFIGTTHCVGCGNGLDALTLILRAYKEMGIMEDGDEVIVPANTYIATILAITENNLKPVLVEPRIDTFQIDDTRIEEAITPRTRAIMIVHLYGKCAYTDHIGDICDAITCDSSRTTRRLTAAISAIDAPVRLAMRLLTASIQQEPRRIGRRRSCYDQRHRTCRDDCGTRQLWFEPQVCFRLQRQKQPTRRSAGCRATREAALSRCRQLTPTRHRFAVRRAHTEQASAASFNGILQAERAPYLPRSVQTARRTAAVSA